MSTLFTLKSTPFEKWMSRCPAVKYLTPAEFCFPGTHDTGAYQTPDFEPIVSKDAIAHEKLRFLELFQKIATRWTISQPGTSIYQQLVNGVRFLDLRVAFGQHQGKPTYFLVHTFAVALLDEAIADIKRFVTSHPTELVIMNVEPYYECNDGLLQREFERQLGAFMYPNHHGNCSFTKNETVAAILSTGKRIIGVYRQQVKTASSLWYPEAELFYEYGFKSINHVPEKQKWLMEQIRGYQGKKFNPTKMFLMAYTLTEATWDVAESVFTGMSLVELADQLNPTLMKFVQHMTEEERRLINVITIDHHTHSNVIDVCIFLNEERMRQTDMFNAPPVVKTPPKDFKGFFCCVSGEDSDAEEKNPLMGLGLGLRTNP